MITITVCHKKDQKLKQKATICKFINLFIIVHINQYLIRSKVIIKFTNSDDNSHEFL